MKVALYYELLKCSETFTAESYYCHFQSLNAGIAKIWKLGGDNKLYILVPSD